MLRRPISLNVQTKDQAYALYFELNANGIRSDTPYAVPCPLNDSLVGKWVVTFSHYSDIDKADRIYSRIMGFVY